MPEVLRQEWLESERGWGTRPDGFSLHVNKVALDAFVKAYWDGMPASPPDDYSRPVGEPTTIRVSENLYQLVIAKGNGIRRHVPLTEEEMEDSVTALPEVNAAQAEIEKMLENARREASSLQNLTGALENAMDQIEAHTQEHGYDTVINDGKPAINSALHRAAVLTAGAVGRATAYNVALQAVRGKKTEAS